MIWDKIASSLILNFDHGIKSTLKNNIIYTKYCQITLDKACCIKRMEYEQPNGYNRTNKATKYVIEFNNKITTTIEIL